MPRKFSRPRFPFIIADVNRETPHETADFTQHNELLDDIRRILQEIHDRNGSIDEKIVKFLKKMVVLESSLDELLERASIEKSEIVISDSAMRSFFAELVPVMDNLEQLRHAIMENGQADWQRGMTMFYEKVVAILEIHGFRMSATVAEKFNPEYHESVSVDRDSHLPEGTIAEIIEPGWLYNESVLRYAKVAVAKENE